MPYDIIAYVKSITMPKRIVHVIGTGTIGEPLIGLLTDFQKELDIDEVSFHKRIQCLSPYLFDEV